MTETTNVTDSRKELNEIRRNNLELIRLRYGSMSAVNVAVGRKCTDSTFTQIRNRVFNSSTGYYREMGTRIARELEEKLRLDEGWMDRPHESAEEVPLPELGTTPPGTNNGPECSDPISGEPALSFLMKFLSGICKDITKLRAVVMDDSRFPALPSGTLLIIDTGVRSFTRDGFYLLKIGEQTAIRKISQTVTGGFRVWSDADTMEEVSDPSALQVVGRAVRAGKVL